MDDRAMRIMAEEEQNYWWHISRRLILQTILSRFFGRHAFEPTKYSLLRHSGKPAGASRIFSLRHPELDSGSPENRFLVEPGMTTIKILDVGCGTGANFAWLSKFGEVTGVEINKMAIELAHREGKVVWGRAEDLPVEDKSFDLVVAFDVLEHLSDETRSLKEWGRVLNSHGKLFIAVPAYPWLFGPHDRALDHYRRYSLRGLNKLLKQNGFKPVFYSYIFCLTFPLFFMQRFLVRNSKETKSQYISIPKWLNNFLIGLGKIEALWLKWFKFPYGSSIVILAEKNE